MTDSHYKERNFIPGSVLARLFLPLSRFPTFLKKNTGQRKQKCEAPFLFAKESIGARVLFSILTFAVVAHPPVAVFAFALV